MARSEARISVQIWNDPDFLARSAGAQRMFMFLLSQQDLAHTGVLALRERRWARAAAGLTVADIRAALDELAAHRFVVVDEDAEELLIRSFIRGDKVYRQPNVLRAAADHLPIITSPAIRQALAVELARIAAEPMPKDCPEIIQAMRDQLPNPSGNPPPNPSRNPGGHSADVWGRQKDEEGERPADSTPVIAAQNPQGNPFRKPSRKGSAGTPGERGVVTAVTTASPFPVPRSPDPVPPSAGNALALVAALPEPSPPAASENAQTLVAEWLDHCRKRPPGTVIGQVGKHVKAMLGEGIDPGDVRAGLAAWWRKGVHPSVLPSMVNELMNAAPVATRSSGADMDWDAAMRRAQAREAAL